MVFAEIFDECQPLNKFKKNKKRNNRSTTDFACRPFKVSDIGVSSSIKEVERKTEKHIVVELRTIYARGFVVSSSAIYN